MAEIILVANPGSASRKYALYDGDKVLAKFHFEPVGQKIVCGSEVAGQKAQTAVDISHLSFAASQLPNLLAEHKLLKAGQKITRVALRIVAPGEYFQIDRLIDQAFIKKLSSLETKAPLHINASLQEAAMLAKYFDGAKLVGISDSAFHSHLPARARYYGLPTEPAAKFGIVRYGYQGLSVKSTVEQLKAASKLPARLVVCHLGSGSSVTAVRAGQSIDTTMGYSPLEGVVMATRSGSIDLTAALELKTALEFSDVELENYLNQRSGLLGISGLSDDIRELLKHEPKNPAAALALEIYVYKIQQAIGQMAAALSGVDALVFTGTVGERSAPMRRRIIHGLMFLGLGLDPKQNHVNSGPGQITQISPPHHPAKIYIVPANEAAVMAERAAKLT